MIEIQKYQKIITDLTLNQSDQLFNQLLHEVQLNHKTIWDQQKKIQKPTFESFLINGTKQAKSKWFTFLNKLLIILYGKSSSLLKGFYKTLPELMAKYIKSNEIKYENLDECLLTIYNNEYQRYNKKNEEKIEFNKDGVINKLYHTHLNKEMSHEKRPPLNPIHSHTNLTKNFIKNILFFLIYEEASQYDEETLLNYYRTLFIYCGADEKEVSREYSLYLLEKKNLISIFKYAISEEEFEWIILTLYELCIKVKKHKFELLAAINIVHKKTSNECQFKMSEIAQSLIHLLEDEYSQVFG